MIDFLKESVRVKLDLFEGPLDLLLHLIQNNHIDISAISLAQITDQYLETIQLMKELDLDIAGEYLVTAATLVLIKSKTLLPPSGSALEMDDINDSQEELIRRLKEYEIFKKAGVQLGIMEDDRSHQHSRPAQDEKETFETEWVIDVSMIDLLTAIKNIMERRKEVFLHIVKAGPVSIRQKMSWILNLLNEDGPVLLSRLFDTVESRQEMIAVFLAILELVRIQTIRARQKIFLGDIRLVLNRPRTSPAQNE
ncbi:MAG: segregation/condensation protein A [bacterium]